MAVLIYGLKVLRKGRRKGPECRESENPAAGLR